MTATSRSRATGPRPGPTSSATSRACRRIRGSAGCRRATSTPGTAYAAFDRHTFGDMRPTSFDTDRLRQDLDSARHAAGSQGVRGYAHVIKEDLVQAEPAFPRHRVRALHLDRRRQEPGRNSKAAVSRRSRCAISRSSRATTISSSATHGRGIWIIDDITPLRALDARFAEAGSEPLSRREPVQQRIEGNGGWANGDAVFVGDNPPDAAVITYYQRSRHLFGKLKIEVLDAAAGWSMNCPRASAPGSIASSGACARSRRGFRPRRSSPIAGIRGPRLLPGVYTVRMTKGGKVYRDEAHDRLSIAARNSARPIARRSSTRR